MDFLTTPAAAPLPATPPGAARPLAWVAALGTISAAGAGLAALRAALFDTKREFLSTTDGLCAHALAAGVVDEALLAPGAAPRTARLIDACLAQMPELPELVARTGPARSAVVLGATTSGMPEVEAAMRVRAQTIRRSSPAPRPSAAMRVRAQTGALAKDFSIRALNLNEPARHAAARLGITGPVYTISNACASGAMAVISGVRLLAAGLADLVLAGGVDSLSAFTVTGFDALGVLGKDPARPFAASRRGINLGEGGALLVLTREPLPGSLAAVTGFGATCDAHHISAPEPEGAGVRRAMQLALESAHLAPDDIDLVSAHGTGTVQNDAAEARALRAVFGSAVPVASYKRITGHTLAGAGALQAALAAAHFLDNPGGALAPNASDVAADPGLNINVINRSQDEKSVLRLGRPVRHILTNAFAFGGSNACVIYSRCPAGETAP